MKKGNAWYRSLTLIAGLAVAVGVGQFFFFDLSEGTVSNAETEQSEEAAFVSMPSVSLPSSSSVVETNQEFSFILEILFEDSHQEAETAPFNRVFDKLLQALFRFVISPNAP